MVPPVPEDYFSRYGRILVPGTEMSHPLKLALPFPDVGEVKVPTADELVMRDKLEKLAALSDDDIRKQLEEWPPYGKMNLGDDGTMLMRIQQFRDRRAQIAKKAREELGLSTLTKEQQDQFDKEYWVKRLQMDRELAKQFEPIFQAQDQKLKEELFRKYSSSLAGVPGKMAAKPTPAVVVNAKPSAAPTPSSSMSSTATGMQEAITPPPMH